MKGFKRVLAFLLAVCMVLSSGSIAAYAETGSEAAAAEATAETGNAFYKIMHLDAARKYFSAEEIMSVIDIAADSGYNQLELYLSDNQGFRFQLDDMIIKTDSAEYDLSVALGAGYDDEPHYTDGKSDYLTQSEMDDIIAYAKTRGIGVVPCINAPGHMGAILENFTDFCYRTEIEGTVTASKSALNLQNTEAY